MTAAAALSFVQPAKANLITNPGFETGNFNGWPAVSGFLLAQGTVFGVPPHSGSWQAFTLVSGILGQSVATTVGQSYTVDFWAATVARVRLAFWGGQQFSVIFLQGQRATPSSRLLSPPRAPLRRYNLALLVAFFWTTSALLRREYPMAARQFLCLAALC
jgi:hypothetical protein